jgi:hypothetical protein
MQFVSVELLRLLFASRLLCQIVFLAVPMWSGLDQRRSSMGLGRLCQGHLLLSGTFHFAVCCGTAHDCVALVVILSTVDLTFYLSRLANSFNIIGSVCR